MGGRCGAPRPEEEVAYLRGTREQKNEYILRALHALMMSQIDDITSVSRQCAPICTWIKFYIRRI